MTGPEQRLARVLAEAGVRDLAHLAALVGEPQSKVWRYFTGATKRLDSVVVGKIAAELGMSEAESRELIADYASQTRLWFNGRTQASQA